MTVIVCRGFWMGRAVKSDFAAERRQISWFFLALRYLSTASPAH